MALFNLLGYMFLIIEVVLNEPLDGAVKSNFYLSHSVYARQFLSWQRESLEMQAYLPTQTGNLKTFFRSYLHVHFSLDRFTLSCRVSVGDGVWNVFWICALY